MLCNDAQRAEILAYLLEDVLANDTDSGQAAAVSVFVPHCWAASRAEVPMRARAYKHR